LTGIEWTFDRPTLGARLFSRAANCGIIDLGAGRTGDEMADGGDRRQRRVALVVVAGLCLVASCGSRKSGAPAGSEEGSGTTTASTAVPGGLGDRGTVGTLEPVCGSGHRAHGATDRGVTDSTITIGVISDKSGVVSVPTAGIDGSVDAFVQFCNSFGGINGRRLVLKHYDSKILNEGDAMRQACDDDIFALVGSGSVQDDQGAVTMVHCELVEIAAYTATYVKGLSPRVFSPVPNPGTEYAVGPGKLIAAQFPDAVKTAAILWPNLPVGRTQAARQRDAYEQAAGFDFVYANPTDVLVQNWGPIVASLQDKHVAWVTDVTTLTEMEHLMQAASDAGWKPTVIDLGQQYYDESLPGKPGTDGALVLTNTVPFEEADRNAALQVYLRWLKAASPHTPPTTLGVQAFSAGLLFAQATSALGSDVTRSGLVNQLKAIKHWDGGGLQAPADPGDNQGLRCFLYMQVKGTKFVRYWPKLPTDGTSGFDCSDTNSVHLQKRYEPLPPGFGP
jgi:ABC-type branched-subunit amino acid transport system substrate-binding protein